MADFNFVTTRLATGAAISSAADVAELVAAGITHIVDCRDDFDDSSLLTSDPQISYLWNGTADDGQHKPPEWFYKSVDFALGGLVHSKSKVYAHCAAGINRGPSTAFAIMLALGWTDIQAEAQMRLARPQVGIAYKQDAIVAMAAWL